jgi:molybdate transport system substrate-binding protein
MFVLRLVVATLLCSGISLAESIRVGIAISLKDAMDQVVKDYESDTAEKVELVYGSSGQIAAQITSGAPIDLFISAANKQVDDLAREGLLKTESRRVVAGNTLVLIVPADAKSPPSGFQSLADASVKRIAIGDPKSVPAGDYSMQVLKSLKLDETTAARLIYGANVRQVLAYVERGEVDAGIVYSTDARESGNKVKVVATADATLHQPIEYPAAVVKASGKPEAAKRFLDYLASPKARDVLSGKGFSQPGAPDRKSE